MKIYIKSAGYSGYSMSNNAVAAYEDGEMPLSKWTKSAILETMSELEMPADVIAEAKNLPVKALKDIFLYKSSWHHTSRMYNKTDFYSVNPDVTIDDIHTYMTSYVPNKKSAELIDPQYQFCDVTYGEWEGSKRHPKLVEYDDYAIRVDNWAYVYNNGSIKKKKVDGSHFAINSVYSTVPSNLQKVFDKLMAYINK